MWWLDDSFTRGNSWDRGPILFRANFPFPNASGANASKEVLRSQLTDEEILANKRLMEGPSEPQPESAPSAVDRQALQQRLTDTERAAQERADESRREARRLRELLADTEAKLASREKELDQLEAQLRDCQSQFAADLAEAQQQHAAESRWLRSIAQAAEGRAAKRKESISALKEELDQVRDDNAHHLRDAAVSFYEKSVAEDALQRNQQELAAEVARLTAENQKLRRQWESCPSEQPAGQSKRDVAIAKQAAVIDKLRQQLQVAEDHSRRADAAAMALQNEGEELRLVADLLKEDAATAKTKYEKRIGELKRELQRERDEAADLARRAHAGRCQLQAECDRLKRRLDQASEASDESTRSHAGELVRLRESVADYEDAIESLMIEIDQANSELDRKQGSLERIQLENDRYREIQNDQFVTLQSRIDQLMVELASEKRRSKAARMEAQRLAESRSGRIAFLSRQREQLLAEVKRLRGLCQQDDASESAGDRAA